MLMELIIARPGYISSADLITLASVVSITSGASTPIDSFFTVFADGYQGLPDEFVAVVIGEHRAMSSSDQVTEFFRPVLDHPAV